MNKLINLVISALNDLNITLPIFITVSGIVISLISFLLARKAYIKNNEKNLQKERRTFINDCKPLINNEELTPHQEIMLINSYFLIKGEPLDIFKLKDLMCLSKSYFTLNHFISAGHLINIKDNKIIKKSENRFISLFKKLWTITLFSTVIVIYFSIIFGIPKLLNTFLTEENKNGVALLYIIVVLIGMSVMLWAFNRLLPLMDSIYPLKQLLKLNELARLNNYQLQKGKPVKPCKSTTYKKVQVVIPRKFPKRYTVRLTSRE